jgi:hypothetical protein
MATLIVPELLLPVMQKVDANKTAASRNSQLGPLANALYLGPELVAHLDEIPHHIRRIHLREPSISRRHSDGVIVRAPE